MLRVGLGRRTLINRMTVPNPSFLLYFADLGSGQVNLVESASAATGTFTRATIATTFDSAGTAPIQVNSGVPRSYYDPATHAYLGYLAEGARTNLLLNSKIDGTNLATQAVVVSNQAYTFSFYGTGNCVVSGQATTTVTGTGAYPTRTQATFTPAAGTVTLTISGTVQYANFEAGSFASSYIPTAGATVTRNADVLTYPTTGWLNASAGTLFSQGRFFSIDAGGNFTQASINDTTSSQHVWTFQTGGTAAFQVRDGGTNQCNLTSAGVTVNTDQKYAGAYAANDFAYSRNAGTVITDTSGTVPVVTRMEIGSDAVGSTMFGPISRVAYFPRRLSDGVLQQMTSQ